MKPKIAILAIILPLISALTAPVSAAVPQKAMVASADPAATEAGLAVLRRGGNAVDAAVAVQMVLNVVEPESSGIGGGCFILFYRRETGEIFAVDGREEAPRAADERMFLDASGNEIPFYPERITGGNAVGVPGAVKALRKAWENYGSRRIEWADLFTEAARLAREGFPVSRRLAVMIAGEKGRLALFPASKQIYLHPDGSPLNEGEKLVQPDLARTLELIAAQGADVFYKGEIAADIAAAVRDSPVNPGRLAAEDLAGYDAPLRQPVYGRYRGYEIVSMPPPSSGGITLLETLNILERFSFEGLTPESAEFVHLFSEAQKLAFADRNRYLGDPDFTEIPVKELVSKDLAADKSITIDRQQAFRGKAEPTVLIALGNTSTSHVSIVDAEGNFLAMTTTIEHIFGSALTVPGRGFILNNELTDFDARPELPGSNAPSPNRPDGARRPRKTTLDLSGTDGGKRPLSSMAPTLIFKDNIPFAALGSPGGTQIIGTVLNLVVNTIDFGMPALRAMAAPRIINRNGPLEIEEPLFNNESLLKELRRRGHEVIRREPFGNAQLIVAREDGRLEGASDPRGEGTARELET